MGLNKKIQIADGQTFWGYGSIYFSSLSPEMAVQEISMESLTPDEIHKVDEALRVTKKLILLEEIHTQAPLETVTSTDTKKTIKASTTTVKAADDAVTLQMLRTPEMEKEVRSLLKLGVSSIKRELSNTDFDVEFLQFALELEQKIKNRKSVVKLLTDTQNKQREKKLESPVSAKDLTSMYTLDIEDVEEEVVTFKMVRPEQVAEQNTSATATVERV